jgi:hypothetical protein
MVFVRLIGGLGNQFFQYALGRHIAEIHRTELKIDISGFETYKLHKYSLWPFNIRENFAVPEEVKELTECKQGAFERLIGRKFGRSLSPAARHIREKFYHFNPEILSLPDGVYLDGYWQSEKYFVDIEAIIRKEFTVKTPQGGKDKELAELIASCESVSLHIRRLDFVSDPRTSQFHGTCDLDYYYRGVEKLAQTVTAPHLFVFGDDPEWVSNNLRLPYPTTLVDHNGADKNYEDLRLMSQCKHNIIANSTFSWWGAWLNQNPNKIVIAPAKWINKPDNPEKYINFVDDLLPPSWLRI